VVDGPSFGPDIDPMDLEVTPGVRRKDVIEGPVGGTWSDPQELQVTPGIRRMDVVEGPSFELGVDPLDLEVTPGIQRRYVIQGKIVGGKRSGPLVRESVSIPFVEAGIGVKHRNFIGIHNGLGVMNNKP